MTRYAQRTLIQQPTIANWGKTAGGGLTWAKISGGTANPAGRTPSGYSVSEFLSDGTLTVSSAGVAECLVVGSGGGPYSGAVVSAGAGGAGHARALIWFEVGTYAVKVAPAQGSSNNAGFSSNIAGKLFAGGGGGTAGHASRNPEEPGVNGGGMGGFHTSSSRGAMVSNAGGVASLGGGGGFRGGDSPGNIGGGGAGAYGNASNQNAGPGVDHSDYFGNAATTNYFCAGGKGPSGSNGTGYNRTAGSGCGSQGGVGDTGVQGCVYVKVLN
jgi:hypothetical protein